MPEPENQDDALDDGVAEHLFGAAPVQERIRQLTQQSLFHQGPIPHPDIFKQYGEVIADAPERIFEQDSAHAREMHMAQFQAQKNDNRRVHWMA